MRVDSPEVLVVVVNAGDEDTETVVEKPVEDSETCRSRIKGGWPGQKWRPEVIISKSCKQPISFLSF